MYPNVELEFDTVKIQALYGRHTDLKTGFNDLLNDRLLPNPLCQADPGIASLQAVSPHESIPALFASPIKLIIFLIVITSICTKASIFKGIKIVS